MLIPSKVASQDQQRGDITPRRFSLFSNKKTPAKPLTELQKKKIKLRREVTYT